MNYDRDKYELHLSIERAKRGVNLSFAKIVFDPAKHRRDLTGKFMEMVKDLKPGQTIHLPDGSSLKRHGRGDIGREFLYKRHSRDSNQHAYSSDQMQEMVHDVLSQSAQHEHPGAIGGAAHFRDLASAEDAMKTGKVKTEHFHPARGVRVEEAQKDLDKYLDDNGIRPTSHTKAAVVKAFVDEYDPGASTEEYGKYVDDAVVKAANEGDAEKLAKALRNADPHSEESPRVIDEIYQDHADAILRGLGKKGVDTKMVDAKDPDVMKKAMNEDITPEGVQYQLQKHVDNAEGDWDAAMDAFYEVAGSLGSKVYVDEGEMAVHLPDGSVVRLEDENGYPMVKIWKPGD